MTRRLFQTVLYVALALGANPGFAGALTPAELSGLRDGDMRKLVVHSEPKPVPAVILLDMDGGEQTLASLAGQYVLLNFWATWCAPCRKEMPSLDALEVAFGGADFVVRPVAAGRNPVPAIEKFWRSAELTALQSWRDPKMTLAGQMGVFGLPATILLDPEGREIARMTGDANWFSEEAVALVSALLGRAE